ncbi:MAG: glycosyltransferase [Alphaproteobacteria bacterium]
MAKHLLHIFPSFEVGGSQLRTVTWINALGPAYHHSLLSLSGLTDACDRIQPSIPFDVVKTPEERASLFSRIRAYRRLLREVGPDVLITNNWGSIELALAWRIRPQSALIHVESGFGPDEADQNLQRRIWVRRAALSGRAKVVVPSASLRRRMTEEWGFSEDRIRFVPDGIDCEKFASALAKPLSQLGDRKGPVIGTVAVLRAEKDLLVLLRAFQALDPALDATLVIVGDGQEREALENEVVALGLQGRVIFTGFVDRVETVYPLFDVFALSSFTEQMPNAVLQAMAAGLPVAATDVGDVSLMVAPENASRLVQPRDASALSAALLELLADPQLAGQLGEENRKRAFQRFDMDAMVAAYRSLIDPVESVD